MRCIRLDETPFAAQRGSCHGINFPVESKQSTNTTAVPLYAISPRDRNRRHFEFFILLYRSKVQQFYLL